MNFFLQPFMLWGTALVGVPIIIYLLHRRRFQRRRWAAMEFLLRAVRRHRRRIQLQNLLLLLIRCLIIVLLALAMSRPILREGTFIVSSSQKQNWILAIDTSYSMGFEADGQSLFDRAREAAFKLVDHLMEPGDRVALMTVAAAPAILVPPVEVTEQGKGNLRRELEDMRLSAASADIAASVATMAELCAAFDGESGRQPKRVVLFSDLQRKDWLGEGGPKDPAIASYLTKMQEEGADFAIATLSTLPRSNLAVTQLTANPALIARDVWVEFRATVRNFGTEDARNIDFTVQVDAASSEVAGGGDGATGARGEPQLGEVLTIPAGETRTTILPYRFDTPGYHSVVAELRSDGLLVDNRRHLVVKVEDDVKVLLVDGAPDANPLERETFHLEVALAPQGDSLGVGQVRYAPFEPEYVTAGGLDSIEWSDYAVVVLANVRSFGAEAVDGIKRFVRRGGALMVFLGDQVEPAFYNEAFFESGDLGRGRDGDGRDRGGALLPAKLEEVHGVDEFPVHLVIDDATHPVARYFEEHKASTRLKRSVISFYRYYKTLFPAEEVPGLRVPFVYSDADSTPAVFDNPYGNGRVLWFTSTADQAWNDLSAWPDFVVFLYESISYLVRFGSSNLNLEVGEVFSKTYASADYASQISLLMPEEPGGLDNLTQGRQVNKAMSKLEGEGSFELVHEQTAVPGVYTLELTRPNSAKPDSLERFAVNVDTTESDLAFIVPDDLRSTFSDFKFQLLDVSERLRKISEEQQALRGREFWRSIMWAVLILLFVETFLAWFFGRRHS